MTSKTFEQAWAETGYVYGKDALENVRLGWRLARANAGSRDEAIGDLMACTLFFFGGFSASFLKDTGDEDSLRRSVRLIETYRVALSDIAQRLDLPGMSPIQQLDEVPTPPTTKARRSKKSSPAKRTPAKKTSRRS